MNCRQHHYLNWLRKYCTDIRAVRERYSRSICNPHAEVLYMSRGVHVENKNYYDVLAKFVKTEDFPGLKATLSMLQDFGCEMFYQPHTGYLGAEPTYRISINRNTTHPSGVVGTYLYISITHPVAWGKFI